MDLCGRPIVCVWHLDGVRVCTKVLSGQCTGFDVACLRVVSVVSRSVFSRFACYRYWGTTLLGVSVPWVASQQFLSV